MTGHDATRPRPYPVGIPVRPPPGWVPPVPRRPGASPFRAQVGLILRAMMLSFLVMVCMGVGWFLVNGRRPARPDARVASVPAKQDRPEPPPPEKEKEQPKPVPAGRKLTYERDVLPLLDEACLRCHGEKRKSAGLDLRTLAALTKGGDSGPGVVPGVPDKSPLYETIESGSMPPGQKKMTAAEKATIRAWIAGGANGATK